MRDDIKRARCQGEARTNCLAAASRVVVQTWPKERNYVPPDDATTCPPPIGLPRRSLRGAARQQNAAAWHRRRRATVRSHLN